MTRKLEISINIHEYSPHIPEQVMEGRMRMVSYGFEVFDLGAPRSLP
jgi:hypothetical protein